jgi:hypothetical protein
VDGYRPNRNRGSKRALYQVMAELATGECVPVSPRVDQKQAAEIWAMALNRKAIELKSRRLNNAHVVRVDPDTLLN